MFRLNELLEKVCFFDIFLNSSNIRMNYNITILIEGQFGQVYLGTLLSDDLPQGIPVAIKTVKSRKNSSMLLLLGFCLVTKNIS